jgi:ABC-type transporter Mla subunit MlaD
VSLLAQDERLTRRVGAIALCVIALAIVFFVFVYDQLELGSTTRIRVYLHHSAGLREHAPLVVGGQPIGRIEAIQSVPHGGANPLHGELGVVALVAIEGEHAWKVPRAAEIFVASHGPLSDKYLEVAPPKGDPGPAVHEGDELVAPDPPSLDNMLQHTWTNMTMFRAFAEQVHPEMQALRGELATLGDNLDAFDGVAPLVLDAAGLAARARHTYDVSLGGEPGLERFGAMVKHARATLAQARATIDRVAPEVDALAANATRARGRLEANDPVARLEATIARVRSVLDKVEPLLAQVDAIGDRLAKGEGSLGRLMNDPEFPEDAKELGKILKRQPWKVIARPKD